MEIVFRRSFLQKDGEITLRFVSIALVYGKVIPNAEHQKQLEDFFGKPLDLNIVNDIITDEAKVLGIPAQQHFQFCLLSWCNVSFFIQTFIQLESRND